MFQGILKHSILPSVSAYSAGLEIVLQLFGSEMCFQDVSGF